MEVGRSGCGGEAKDGGNNIERGNRVECIEEAFKTELAPELRRLAPEPSAAVMAIDVEEPAGYKGGAKIGMRRETSEVHGPRIGVWIYTLGKISKK